MKITKQSVFRQTILCGCAAAAVSLAPVSQAQVLFSQDFDGQTPGATASGFTFVSPATATPLPTGRGGVIVDEGGLDRAVHIYDYDGAGNVRLEQDFTPLSSVHLSLDFRRNADVEIPSGENTKSLYVTFGLNGLGQHQQANRAIEFRLFNDGQVRVNRGFHDVNGAHDGTGVASLGAFEPAGITFDQHNLDLFVYSGLPGGAPMAYIGPDSVARVLDPNSFSVFIDNAFIAPPSGATANGNFGIFQSTIYNTGDNLGRFGLVSGGANSIVDIDFIIDNISIQVIPEPSTWALLAMSGVALAGMRRRLAAKG